MRYMPSNHRVRQWELPNLSVPIRWPLEGRVAISAGMRLLFSKKVSADLKTGTAAVSLIVVD